MRIRETKDDQPVPFEVKFIGTENPPSPASPAVWVSGAATNVDTKRVVDTTCPNFAELLKCGEFLPLNPFEIRREWSLVKPGEVDVTLSQAAGKPHFWGTDARFVSGKNPLMAELPGIDNAILAAVTNSAAAKAANGGWDILTFFGELRETVALITQLTRAMSRARIQMAVEAAAFKRNPWSRFKSYWLAGRYGVRPIWYDYLAAVEALERLLDGTEYTWNKGKAYRKVPIRVEKDSGWIQDGNTYDVRTILRWEGEYTYRAWSAARLDWLGRATNGALSADAAVTAWELTRMSFVIDRFIDVGSYIGALSAQLRGLTLGTCASYKMDVMGYASREYRVRSGFGTGTWGSGEITTSLKAYTRYPVEIPPVPSLDIRLDLAFVVDLVTLFVGGERKVQKILQRR